MSRKVPAGRRADVTYLLSSPYFILNFASLLIYPGCRLGGMRNQALSMFSESVSPLPSPYLANHLIFCSFSDATESPQW